MDETIDEITSDTGRFAQVPEWVIEACKPRALVVYLYLALLCDYDNRVLKGYSHIELAERAGVSHDTVARAITELVAAGALTVEKVTREDGYTGKNRYQLIRARPISTGLRKSASRHTQNAPKGTRTDACTTTRQLLHNVSASEIEPAYSVPADRVKQILDGARKKPLTDDGISDTVTG